MYKQNLTKEEFKKSVETDFMLKYKNMDSSTELNNYNIKSKKTLKYKKFEELLNNFFDDCDEENILARADWTCCNTCGNYEIYDERKIMEDEYNNKYLAYIFYHLQEADSIYSQCNNDNDVNDSDNSDNPKVKVYFNWGYFNDDDLNNDPDGKALGEKIKEIAEKKNIQIEFTDFNKKLIMIINTNY